MIIFFVSPFLSIAHQTPNRLNVPHDRVLICVVPGMPCESTLKWGLSVCGDHEMTLQYACGTPTFFHLFVYGDVSFPLSASLISRPSLSPYISLFSLFLPLSILFPFSICLPFSLAFLIGYALR